MTSIIENPTEAAPLTPDEIKWCKALARVLARCPERLELVTRGYATLAVIDGDAEIRLLESTGRGCEDADQLGYVLARIPSGCTIHGVG